MNPADLRPLDPSEIEKVCDLWHQGWRDGHEGRVPEALVVFRDRKTFLARIKASVDQCFVAGPLGAPVGFVRLIGAEIDQFYVAKEARGTGFAKGLITAAEDRLRAAGVGHAHLYCLVGNPRAERFYEKAGWQNAGQEDLPAETLAEPVPLRCIRFEKTL